MIFYLFFSFFRCFALMQFAAVLTAAEKNNYHHQQARKDIDVVYEKGEDTVVMSQTFPSSSTNKDRNLKSTKASKKSKNHHTKSTTMKSETPSPDNDDITNPSSSFVWTKLGLEQIPWNNWRLFTEDPTSPSLYIKGFPFPGEQLTDENFMAWKSTVNSNDSLESMLAHGFIVTEEDKMEAMKVYEDYSSVPTLYSDPIVLEESFIDYRLQHSADIGGSYMIGESASRGRLVNPAGRRLREHYYRFPDQCDATPIALEVFLRLMM